MAYTLNSAKDARGDEHLFLQEFTARQAEIEASKRQHGGDLEAAFQRVTGKPWPAGRSVKISHGVPEMTKDRTVRSVLGKVVLPAAAAALTGGAALGVGPLAGVFGAGAVGAAGTAGAAGTVAGTTGAAGTVAGTTAAAAPSLLSRVGGFLAGNAGRIVDVGRTAAGAAGAAATQRNEEARLQAAIYQTQANLAKQQTDAARQAQQMGLARGQIAAQTGLAAPTLAVPGAVQGRTATLTLPTLPTAGRDALLARLQQEIPAFVPPPAPVNVPGRMEQGLGAAALIAQLLGAAASRTPRTPPTA